MAFITFHILEMSSSQLTISHIFQRGRSTTNQNQMVLAICLRRVKFTQSDKLSGTPGQLPGFALKRIVSYFHHEKSTTW